MFAQGLAKPMVVPLGTLAEAQGHVREVERRLGLVAEKYLDNPAHWRSTAPTIDVTDVALCKVALQHDEWIDSLWNSLDEWHKNPPTGETEVLTPEDAATFWHGTQAIEVPIDRWSREYYQKRMEEVYKIMRGRSVNGCCWQSKSLTPQQAAGVIWLFSEYLGLDAHDVRMDAPWSWEWSSKARRKIKVQLDEVQPSCSYDGEGYEWCEKCGAVAQWDGDTGCPRRKSQCPIKRERPE